MSGQYRQPGEPQASWQEGKGTPASWLLCRRQGPIPRACLRFKAARNRPLTPGQKLSITALEAVRTPVEHGCGRLKNRRVLGKVRTEPISETALVRALLVLANCEVAQ